MTPFLFLINGKKINLLTKTLVLPFILAGCATWSKDGGFSSVEQAARQHVGKEVVWQRSEDDTNKAAERVKELLSSNLSVDDAVQIALFNNRGLQASFYELGISEADLVQAGRLPNPGFSFARTRQDGDTEIDRGVVVNIARLLMMPVTRRIEHQRFEQTQREVTMRMLSVAAEIRKAYFSAVAADQTLLYMRDVKKAADASAELARRLVKVGNFTQLQQAREQSFYSEAILNLARAEQTQIRNRERLTRLMGLHGDQIKFSLPSRLPDLPKVPEESSDVEQAAMLQRIDVQEARLGAERLAKNLDLSQATRFIYVLEVGAVRNTFTDQPIERGYTVSLELPLFDWGDAKVSKAEALYQQAFRLTQETIINARSEVREAYAIYRSNFDIARHYYDEVVPLKKRISEENQLLYNGMFISVFELLADARSQIISVTEAIDASRNFWIAKADMDMSLLGRSRINQALTNGDTQSD